MAENAHSTPVPASRRGFLRGLVSLPLIGGGVTLIGAPSAVAEPVTPALLDSYDAWLFYERQKLKSERIGEAVDWDNPVHQVAMTYIPVRNAGFRHHFGRGASAANPSARAALVLSAVGCNWREGGR